MGATINMKLLKRSCIYLLMIALLFGCGTGKQNETDNLYLKERYKVIKIFFKEYGKKEYSEMKKYLTPEMEKEFSKLEKYIPKASLIKIDEKDAKTWDDQYWISVDLKIETTKDSSLYPDTEWKIYILTEKINDTWVISGYTTG